MNPGGRLVTYTNEIVIQYISENKISCTIQIRDHFLVRFLPTVHRHIRPLQGMFVLLGNEICITIINMKLINPSISTSSEHKIDWHKTFHLYHFPPVFDMHPKRSQAP